MKKYAGIWVDHEKAWIASIQTKKEGAQETLQRIESEVEGHIRLAGGSRSKSPFGPQEIASESKKEELRKHQLQRYRRTIANAIGDADKILLLGPGEAKKELEKEMKKSKRFPPEIVGLEAADKMTETQFSAKVRQYFKIGSKNS